MANKVSENIYKLHHKKDMSQDCLSKEADFSLKYNLRIETKEDYNLTLKMLKKLLKRLEKRLVIYLK